jgi:hypothetical protein
VTVFRRSVLHPDIDVQAARQARPKEPRDTDDKVWQEQR